MPATAEGDTLAAIDAAVDGRMPDLLDLLGDLIAIPSETGVGQGYQRVVDHLLPLFVELGFDTQRVDLPDKLIATEARVYHPEMTAPRANLLATGRFSGKPRMLWYTHLDTVPAGPLEHWEHPPFQMRISDEFVYGRGASDSKGAAAALWCAFSVLNGLNLVPSVNPIVALTTDEEIGPYTGLMYLADTGLLDGVRWFHSCDGTATNLGIGYCASFSWRIRVTGRSVHTAISHLGLNPIEQAVALLEQLTALKERVEARRSLIPAQWPRTSGHETVRPTFNTTMARSGWKHNVVPQELTLEGDRRILPQESWDDAVAELHEAVDAARRRQPQLHYDVEILPFYREGWTIDPDDPFVARMATVCAAVRGEATPVGGSAGSSDVSYAANRLGVPTVSHGLARPGESRYHSPNERARLSDLRDLTRIICHVALTPTEPVPRQKSTGAC